MFILLEYDYESYLRLMKSQLPPQEQLPLNPFIKMRGVIGG